MKLLYPTMAAVLLAGTSAGSLAQVAQTDFEPGVQERRATATFDAVDTNGDGVVDREEAEAVGLGEVDFSNLDANDDGYVDRGEFDARTFRPDE